MNNKIAIITVLYNNYDVIQDFMTSLEKQTNRNWELFIADLSDNPQKLDGYDIPFHIIPAENKGYAHGVNVGLKEALSNGIEKFVVINDDVFFKEDFIENIALSFKKNASSVIGAKIYYAPGFEFHKDRYEKKDIGKVLWYAGGSVDWNHALTFHRGVDEVDTGQFDTKEETGFITGCLTCFDKNVVDTIGFWDDEYFLYYEDSDFCERAKRAGIKLIYDPHIILWHKNAQSTGGSGSTIHTSSQKKARLRFGLKYAPLRTKLHLLKNYLLGRNS